MRSFSPSRIFWWTSTESPISNCGTSFLRPASSTWVMNLFFMGRLHRYTSIFLCGFLAALFRLFLPPTGNHLVITAQQYLGPFHLTEHPRPSVLRIFYDARLAVRLLGDA